MAKKPDIVYNYFRSYLRKPFCGHTHISKLLIGTDNETDLRLAAGYTG